MREFAIGDIQGCYDELMQLLECIDFNEHDTRLWFTGDLVNRGPKSLEVLRFIKSLPQKPVITLGNHDLHLIKQIFTTYPSHKGDTLNDILTAADKEELGHWLRAQHILYHDKNLKVLMTHAGISPLWDLDKAQNLARELENALSGDDFIDFLHNMYGNSPDIWQDDLKGNARLRVICNYFTRMRLCDAKGALVLNYKGTLEHAPKDLYPWYQTPNRHEITDDIVFGHWSALEGRCAHPKIHAIDTGCLWGGALTAISLTSKQRFSVLCK